jgi:hypothetical protein
MRVEKRFFHDNLLPATYAKISAPGMQRDGALPLCGRSAPRLDPGIFKHFANRGHVVGDRGTKHSSGSTVTAMRADMRGNTDRSWSRTLDWLIRNRLLAPDRRVAPVLALAESGLGALRRPSEPCPSCRSGKFSPSSQSSAHPEAILVRNESDPPCVIHSGYLGVASCGSAARASQAGPS